jgi:uncharacterized membrane protein YeiH
LKRYIENRRSTEQKFAPRLELSYLGNVALSFQDEEMQIRHRGEAIVLVADLAGTFVFAMEGALAGLQAHLDLLGVMVVAFATALGGGIIRDALIGATPVNAIRDGRYPALAFVAGLLTFRFHTSVQALPPEILLVLDAAGLSLFAVAGAEKAILHGVGAMGAMLMGTLTGVGGGVVRDILLARIPQVLQSDIYASAALLAAVVMLVMRRVGAPPGVAAFLGGISCFVTRLLAVSHGWHLPKVM